MTEILVPAGNEENAYIAINSGADAIYLGLTSFSARAGAENLDEEALKRVIKRAALFGVKVYVAMNTLVKDSELEEFLKTVVFVHNIGADAIILQDIFLGKYIHERYPRITLHLSTQAGVNNIYGAELAKEFGFSRVILARETQIEDIKKIAEFIETEVFIQGALCSSFSGQCYLSGFVGGNSGNRGRCKQPCRKKYCYNRSGFEDKAYALSLADLSVGKDIFKLIDVGVVSFKIEGRMRRPEYVVAAINYYRAVLAHKSAEKELSDLKRTYNRNNYTTGLAFGQDKRFLSRNIQNHMGEKVGVVIVRNRRYYCESNFLSVKGDCFKIIRRGKEIGGAVFEEKDSRGFYISSKERLVNGDGVFVTTDTALNVKLNPAKKLASVNISLCFEEGKKAVVSSPDLCYESEFVLESAKNRSLQKEELIECFNKCENFNVTIKDIILNGNIFIPKSLLNGIRRDFYSRLEEKFTQKDIEIYEPLDVELIDFCEKCDKVAVMSDSYKECDILIFKPNDYNSDFIIPSEIKAEKYLYIPSFACSSDIEIIKEKLSLFDGIYCDGIWGLRFAEETGKKFFAGTGFNITNCIDVKYIKDNTAYYCVSKELSFAEQRKLSSDNSFVLTCGGIKVMDFIYCPFEKTCKNCDKRNLYELSDENGRVFPVHRYEMSSCRFEVYNCSHLVSKQNFAGTLIDLTTVTDGAKTVANFRDENKLKQIFKKYTSGHSDKTIL